MFKLHTHSPHSSSDSVQLDTETNLLRNNILAIQSVVGPWPLVQFINHILIRWYPYGGSSCCMAAAYSQDISNRIHPFELPTPPFQYVKIDHALDRAVTVIGRDKLALHVHIVK
jgi:hypothetical protein